MFCFYQDALTGLVNGCYEQKQEIKKVLDNSKQKVIGANKFDSIDFKSVFAS